MAACSLQARSSLRNSFNSRFNDCSSGPRDAISGETGNVSNCRKFPLHQLAREIWPFCSGLTCVRARELRRHSPLKIWPDLSSAAAATGTDEARLDTREANIVRPAIGAQSSERYDGRNGNRRGRRACPSPASRRSDLDGAAVNVLRRVAAGRGGHAAIETRRRPESNYQSLGSRNARELLRVVGASVPRSRRRR